MHGSKEFDILPVRKRSEIQNQWLAERLETVLPRVMKREGFDMWIVIGREYNEDPVLLSLMTEQMMSATRRTMLVYYLQDEGTLECMLLGRAKILHMYDMGNVYKGVWNADQPDEDQWESLARLVDERDPSRIGINVSGTFAFGDGLTHSEYQMLVDALDDKYVARLSSAERVAVGWLETRTQSEITAYSKIVEIAHSIICEALSTRVIHPGITTTKDVLWWMRQRVIDLGLSVWFHPSVTIQAPGVEWRGGGARTLIQPGDLLHTDFGVKYLGLCTDTQQHAYVLRLGETSAPAGLEAALRDANRLQDILAEEFKACATGNEILRRSLDRATGEGIIPSIYTHPIGMHGHGAGPVIGLSTSQGGVPGRGDYELFDDTCHSMELNIRKAVPEWDGYMVRIALEQDVMFTGGKVHYLAGRQTQVHLVG